MEAVRGGPISETCFRDRLLEKAGGLFRNTWILSMRSLSPRPMHLSPFQSTARKGSMVVIIVLPSYWHSITLWSVWNGRCSIYTFLFLECWMSSLRTNWLSKQLMFKKIETEKWILVVDTTLFAVSNSTCQDVTSSRAKAQVSSQNTTHLASLKCCDVQS